MMDEGVQLQRDNELILRRLHHQQQSIVPYALLRMDHTSRVTLQEAALESIRAKYSEKRVRQLMK